MDAKTLPVENRDNVGTGAARAIRREGKIPAIVYGGKDAPSKIAVDPRDILKGMSKPGFFSTVIHLEAGKNKTQVIPQAVQFHPVTDAPLHADFLRVANDTIVKVTVPVRLQNIERCRGLKMGGSLNVVRHSVEIFARADSIPTEFTIDILEYKIADAVKSSAIALPEGVRYTIDDRDFTIATIAKPRGGLAGDDEDENEDEDEAAKDEMDVETTKQGNDKE